MAGTTHEQLERETPQGEVPKHTEGVGVATPTRDACAGNPAIGEYPGKNCTGFHHII